MNNFQFLIYKSADEDVSVNAIIKDESIWLTQKSMAQLFDVNSQAISKHLNNIYEEGELSRESTCSKIEQVQYEGGRRITRQFLFFYLFFYVNCFFKSSS